MTTRWKKLTRKDLTTFDTFATDAVLTAMQLGGIGSIASNGHAKIRGKNGASMIIARDTSAPHCQGNVIKALRRTFPELKISDAPKDTAMTSNATTTTTQISDMLECPAKGCEQRFATAEMRDTHVDKEHVVCKWEGCNYGPDGGPFVGKGGQAVAGHTNIWHKGNKPWEKNRAQAAAARAATVVRKREKAAERTAEQAAETEALRLREIQQAADAEAQKAQTAAVNGRNSEVSVRQVGVATVAGEDVETPVAVPVENPDALAKLALIAEIIGDDQEVASLKKEIADLKAHLALVREAVGLDFGDDNNK